MKKMHLLCNAHLDPAWIWRWNEGLAEAISTFRIAADFCENYDSFVFNHNEALLYEWVEEHEPLLFERIKKLVADKKWIIMGGWYLQPDCVMTSGESLMSQIRLGREYFKKKFGVEPTAAINFDPFGHSRGLVQILKNAGYDSYIFMRPYEIKGDFLWEGFDGSKIKAHGIYGVYSTLKGKAREKAENYIKDEAKDTGLCLWGIGNHGGGPSKKDLEDLNELISSSDVEIVHSTAEAYMAEIDESKLNVLSQSLIPCMVGCYTSMVRIKQANRRLENKISFAEKIMSCAALSTDFDYDSEELAKAKKMLAFCQFHDILPGTGIKTVEIDSLNSFGFGEEIADKLINKAFLKLCQGQKKAVEGEIPIMIFNPHPYEINGEFEVEFLLQDQNRNDDEVTVAVAYDEHGNALATQNEKPGCTFNLDWVKKVSFVGKLAPTSITRFDCKLTTVKLDEKTGSRFASLPYAPHYDCDKDYIEVKSPYSKVRISKKTGLIESFEVNGKSYIKNSGMIEVYKDDEDPWAMNVDSFCNIEGCFELMNNSEANEFAGYPDNDTPNVRIVEDGAVRTKIQAIFAYKRSVAVVEYTIPKNSAYIDVHILMYSNETNKMLKYKLDTGLSGTPYGETAFGYEELFADERESVFHKWCGIKTEDDALYVVNKGIYGGSFTDSTIKLSLLRTPIYASHPIDDKEYAPHNRFTEHIDMGKREFCFRITTDKDIARQAQIYNQPPMALSFFPSGEGEKPESIVSVDKSEVILSSVIKKADGYEYIFYNASDSETDAEITIKGKKHALHFGKHRILEILD